MKKSFNYLLFLILIIPVLSCCRKNAPQRQKDKEVVKTVVDLVSPAQNTVIHCGDKVIFEYAVKDTSIRVDSVALFNGKDRTVSVKGDQRKLEWNSVNSRMGQTTLRMMVYYSDSVTESHNVNLVILSDIVPLTYHYKVIAKYPHDDQAYTQGLVYDNGILYESTGINGKSSVRIVEIKSGKPLKMNTLDSKFFGEGISLLGDKIYQVTYTTQVGFVYDKKTLEQIRSFDYQFKEGWGLATDGKNLIMTDGSSQMFFIEPEYFTQIDKINVYDNKEMIDSLNEIEFIRGRILSNVYGKTYIVIVDPQTGKVTGKVDFLDLMPEGSLHDMNKVLNGIAYNPGNGHLYITGKNWPVLYEIELIPTLK